MTKVMMTMGIMAAGIGAGTMMYKKNSKKNVQKYMSYLDNK